MKFQTPWYKKEEREKKSKDRKKKKETEIKIRRGKLCTGEIVKMNILNKIECQ